MKTGGKIERSVSRKELFDSFLVILGHNYSQFEPLTKSERDVLARFMELSREEDKFKYNLFGKSAKERIRERMNATKTNVDRYVSIIRTKGYIRKDLDNIDALIGPLEQIVDTDELQLMVNYKVEDGRHDIEHTG